MSPGNTPTQSDLVMDFITFSVYYRSDHMWKGLPMRAIVLPVLLVLLVALLPGIARAVNFRHIVIIVQENRTPDNIFGSLPNFEPGVDIAASGQTSQGQTIVLNATPMAYCYDIGHAHADFVAMYNNGGMNGADQEHLTRNHGCDIPTYPEYKFVDTTHGEVQPYFDIATQYGFANRMFETNQGPSFPAHQFIFGATSAPSTFSTLFASENPKHSGLAGCVAKPGQRVTVIDANGNENAKPSVYPCFDRPTMADLLDAAGIGWKYYIDTLTAGSLWTAPAAIRALCAPQNQNGALVCTGPDYVNNVDSRQAQVLLDVGACALPAVSWVIPDAASSDHAGITNGSGPSWVASIVNAIGSQPACPGGEVYWQDTAIFITWDDWGGWFDHVPPYHTGGWPANNWGAGYTYGFRVPLLVVSAFTQAGYVNNDNLDFGSILAFVESNFGLGRIGPGYYADAWSGNLTPFFSLSQPRGYSPIPTRFPPKYFLHRTRSKVGPDDD
jgi:phospholipase C